MEHNESLKLAEDFKISKHSLFSGPSHSQINQANQSTANGVLSSYLALKITSEFYIVFR